MVGEFGQVGDPANQEVTEARAGNYPSDPEKAKAYVESLEDWQVRLLKERWFLKENLAEAIVDEKYSDQVLKSLEDKETAGTLGKYDKITLDKKRQAAQEGENVAHSAYITKRMCIALLSGESIEGVVLKDRRTQPYITHETRIETSTVISLDGQNGEEKQLAIQEATESIAGQSLVGLVEKYERTKRGKYADILAPEQMDQARDLSLQEANELAERLQI